VIALLGLTVNGNPHPYLQALGNFLVFFLAQLVWELYDLTLTRAFPTEFELYRAFLVSLIATFAFAGINRIAKTEQKPST